MERSVSKFLLDSDVIIWHLRGHDAVSNMLRELQTMDLPACSALSVIEVTSGMKKGEEKMTHSLFDSLHVLDVDRAVADKAAQLILQLRGKGIGADIPDAVIAATCLVHNLILVTYNTKHYPCPELRFHPCPPLSTR